jgi:hypothetical protein
MCPQLTGLVVRHTHKAEWAHVQVVRVWSPTALQRLPTPRLSYLSVKAEGVDSSNSLHNGPDRFTAPQSERTAVTVVTTQQPAQTAAGVAQ